MADQGGMNRDVLERLDSALMRAIRGAIWFPLVYLPRQIRESSLLAYRLLRVGALAALWGAVVFGPLLIVGGPHHSWFAMAARGWTLLTIAGSLGGVFRVWKSSHARPEPGKPDDLREAFV